MKNEDVTWLNRSLDPETWEEDDLFDDNWAVSGSDLFRAFEQLEEDPL